MELTRFATSLVGPSEAQDVVSEAMLRAMWSRSWPEVRNRRAYLYRSVLSESRMHHRSASRRRDREARAAVRLSSDADPVEVDVWDALDHLRVSQRAVVFLTYWEGLSTAEIGERLGVSDRTVRRHLDRARRRLRELLQ